MLPEEINKPKPKRRLEETYHLPAEETSISSRGVKALTTSSPHRSKVGEKFYETWFNFKGGSLRVEATYLEPELVEAISAFLRDLTNVDQTPTVERIVSLYE